MGYPQHRQPGTLTPGEITEWEALPLSEFHLDSFYRAISEVIPDAPCNALELERLVNDGHVKVAGLRWSDGLRMLVAWNARSDQPPPAVVESGYRRAVQCLASLPKLVAKRDFGKGTAPGGHA